MIKKITCHCGVFEAEANIPDVGFGKIVRCNCSICKRKNAFMGMVKNEDFRVKKGEDQLTMYQYHTNIAKHYFCSKCGIYTHHNPRSAPHMTGINLGCIDDIDTTKLKDVAFFDGINHPLDQKK